MPSAAKRHQAQIAARGTGQRPVTERPERRRRTHMLELPEAYRFLFRPARYKVAWSGRGAGKSWAFADALLTLALQRKIRVLCARQFQTSMADSVHRLLKDRIGARGLEAFFTITQTGIQSVTGS